MTDVVNAVGYWRSKNRVFGSDHIFRHALPRPRPLSWCWTERLERHIPKSACFQTFLVHAQECHEKGLASPAQSLPISKGTSPTPLS